VASKAKFRVPPGLFRQFHSEVQSAQNRSGKTFVPPTVIEARTLLAPTKERK
jgi:hypothetical protein